EILDAAQKAGFSFDNVKNAKAKLKAEKGLRHSNRHGGFQGKWWSGFGDPDAWTLRPEAPHTPDTQHSPDNAKSPDNGAAPKPGNVGKGGSVGSVGHSGEKWPEAPVHGGEWQ